MIWRTNKPTEKVIVAKLTEDFCHLKNRYAILRLVNEPYQHYSEDGEEIPYAAIEKWASLEEESDKSLDEAATKFAYSEGYQDPEYYNIVDAFKTGAEFGANHLRNSTKMVDKGLEEAAEDQARSFGYQKEDYEYKELVETFIAGAKWQEKRDEETIKTAEDHAFLAGADWQKEQILKKAKDGYVSAIIIARYLV